MTNGREPVNANLWSEDSKRSYIFESPPKYYRDIHYDCRRCSTPAVFSAKDQKYTFEVKKAYIWQQRLLCESCWTESNRIQKELEEHETRWLSEKLSLKGNTAFLSSWLGLLEEHAKYGGNRNVAIINMLQAMLSKSE